MQHSSELHLIIPGVCGPLAEMQTLKTSSVLDGWVKTLSRSSILPSASNVNDVIAEIFKVNNNDDFPSAALTLLANNMYDADKFYMHADPVHLQADMDHAVLTSSVDLDIKNAESSALCETLNQHFKQDELKFITLNKDQWFVESREKISLNTTPLVDATGRNVNFILPKGEDSARWKQVLTEAQMLLHSHELNTVRENTGLLSINSLWFHGSGELTELNNNDVNVICSQNDMLKGLASHIKCDYLTIPDTVNEYENYLLSCKHGTMSVLYLSELEHLVNYTDVSLWLVQLTELLDRWIYPLLKITNKNNIKVTLYPCNGKRYQFSKYDFLKFWRHVWRKDILEKHVCSY